MARQNHQLWGFLSHAPRMIGPWAVLLSVGFAEAQVGPADPAIFQAVPVPAGLQDLRVENPKALRSKAYGVRSPDPAACQVAARVIVDGNVDEVRRFVGRAGRVVASPAPGFVYVETGSVEQAIRLAGRLMRSPFFGSVELDLEQPRAERVPTDPFFIGQWTLRNTLDPLADVRAVPAWDLGYSGKGVVVGVIELAWQTTHPDLAANFVPEASILTSFVTSHATSVAGIIAADNNSIGGVGIAYDAGISSIRFGLASENATAFLHRNDLNDIKTNSWGPTDNGRLAFMSAIERAAIEQAVREGRDGLGEIIVWAAGNGGLADRMDYDPYSSSRFTLAIGAIGDQNTRATYNEVGSSMLAVAHSSGNVRNVFSTNSNNGYTTTFGGTSASAPLAAGAIALMLEANPALSWRDVQHIIINTARQIDSGDESWSVNAAGRWVSENYGFGAIDAHAGVVAAESWTSTGPEVVADSGTIALDLAIPDDDLGGLSVGIELDRLIRIESFEVVLNVSIARVGDLLIEVVSPGGTTSVLATPRNDSTANLNDHIFTSLRAWDESSAGVWTVRLADQRAGNQALWESVQVRAYGTTWSGACPADLNGDGALGPADLNALVQAIGREDPAVDFESDGLIDFFDVLAYFNLFASGCP